MTPDALTFAEPTEASFASFAKWLHVAHPPVTTRGQRKTHERTYIFASSFMPCRSSMNCSPTTPTGAPLPAIRGGFHDIAVESPPARKKVSHKGNRPPTSTPLT
jgi:hypothetical protein